MRARSTSSARASTSGRSRKSCRRASGLEERVGLVGDQAGERERRRRGRRGRVAYVDRALGAVDDEVVDQRPVAGERLGAYARRAGEYVAHLQLRNEAPKVLDEGV